MLPKRKGNTGGLVYSTEHGTMCPRCRAPLTQCTCGQNQPAPPKDGFVRVGRETKGRKGAGVTVIMGIARAPEQLGEICTQLKKRCGSGGTVKDGVIEIQGDHRDTIVAELTTQGYKVKRVGG